MSCDFCGDSFEYGEFPREELEQRAAALVEIAQGQRTLYGEQWVVTLAPRKSIRFRICTNCLELPFTKTMIEGISNTAKLCMNARYQRTRGRKLLLGQYDYPMDPPIRATDQGPYPSGSEIREIPGFEGPERAQMIPEHVPGSKPFCPFCEDGKRTRAQSHGCAQSVDVGLLDLTWWCTRCRRIWAP